MTSESAAGYQLLQIANGWMFGQVYLQTTAHAVDPFVYSSAATAGIGAYCERPARLKEKVILTARKTNHHNTLLKSKQKRTSLRPMPPDEASKCEARRATKTQTYPLTPSVRGDPQRCERLK